MGGGTCPADNDGGSEGVGTEAANHHDGRITAGPACAGLLSSLFFGCRPRRAAAHERAARACQEEEEGPHDADAQPTQEPTAPRRRPRAHKAHHRASCVAQDVLLDFPRGDGSHTALVVAVTALVHCSGLVFVAWPWIRRVFARR